jgi:hypothetical protein
LAEQNFVSRGSQYLAEGKITGDAVVGSARKARIRVAVVRVMAVFEASLGEFANAIMADRPSIHATLCARSERRGARALKSTSAEAAALPVLIEDESGAGNDQ